MVAKWGNLHFKGADPWRKLIWGPAAASLHTGARGEARFLQRGHASASAPPGSCACIATACNIQAFLLEISDAARKGIRGLITLQPFRKWDANNDKIENRCLLKEREDRHRQRRAWNCSILKSSVGRIGWMQLKYWDYDSHLRILANISQRTW